MNEEEFTLTGIKLDGKSLLLASGSWGEVRIVEHVGIQRAAKRLLSKPADVSKFIKDCVLYSKLVHKNVLPVLGLCECDQSDIPAIVMELMECSLAAKLKQHQNIPVNLKLSMLHDISEGLHYLHTYIPPIVHGNLHSKNIFLTSSLVAKIGDLLPLSMPREACSPFLPQNISCELHAPSLDIFAFGCVVCHVITEQLPMPSGSTLNEVELRQSFIDQIELEALKQLVIISLDNELENRPSISLVCKRITNIRSERITSIRGMCIVFACIWLPLYIIGNHLDQWTSGKTGCNKPNSQTNFLKIRSAYAGKTSLAQSLLSFPITQEPEMHMVNLADHFIFQVKDFKRIEIHNNHLEIDHILKSFLGLSSNSQRTIFIPKDSVAIVTFDEEFFPNIHMLVVHLAYSGTSVEHNIHDAPLHPPVLLAGTHIDLLHSDYEVARAIARARFIPPFIRGFSDKPYTLHLVTMDRTAIAELVLFVTNVTFEGEMATLQDKVKVKRITGFNMKNYPIEHTLLLCQMQVITMLSMITKDTIAENNEDFNSILRDLHDKRAIIQFSQVESLKDVVIPNPHWLAKLFDYVLNAYPHDVLEPDFERAWQELKSTGILHECLLRHILAKYRTDYPSAPYITYQQLRDVLVSFRLLACITNKTTDTGDVFIVPSLAPTSAGQEISLNEQKKAVIDYVFHDDVAPALILNQLIAGCISRTVNRNQVPCW